ncbi:MAG: prephenate dehydratase domain-containing protein [Micropepsaceae bacterium]
MNQRSLFVSFAESDGGHSYLAARAMLNASNIGHLIFRTTVSDALDAVRSGQANFAVVPFYNSITQWEGATVKALASRELQIHAQVCMPTSYVLAAHKEYMAEIVERYRALSDRKEELSPERAKKIYTRFLTRIFVGSQAEEQYRGRLLRPDMSQATIEHARNPLRVLEEIAREELMKDLKYGTSRGGGGTKEQGYGNTILVDMPTRPATISELNVPASLIAGGLLDLQQEPDGWDRHGSVGEIVSLLRNLLELLDVFAFGAPDLPENKTQYILVGRKGTPLPANSLKPPTGKSSTRMMTLVHSRTAKSSPNQWIKPREKISKVLKEWDFIQDRAPIAVSTGKDRTFLMEASLLAGASLKGEPGKRTKAVIDAIESKPRQKPAKGSLEEATSIAYLGEYQTRCTSPSTESCNCCEGATDELRQGPGILDWLTKQLPLLAAIGGTAVVVSGLLFILYAMLYCPLTGNCGATENPTSYHPPISSSPAQPAAETPPPSSYPGVTSSPSQPSSQATIPNAPTSSEVANQAPHTAYPGTGETPSVTGTYPRQPVYTEGKDVSPSAEPKAETHPVPKVAETKPAKPQPTYTQPKPLMLHVAFMEAKSNLTRESYNVLTTAAATALQQNKTVNLRIFALGSRETDDGLWRRRLYTVKDELVRLGVPVERIRSEGNGPFIVIVRANEPPKPSSAHQRVTSSLDSIDDPFANN